jgi:hypothetical protein
MEVSIAHKIDLTVPHIQLKIDSNLLFTHKTPVQTIIKPYTMNITNHLLLQKTNVRFVINIICIEPQGKDINFIIDVNGVPHSVHNSANDTNGKCSSLT